MPDRDLGIEVPSRVMYARDGRVTHRLPIPQTMTAWDRVFHLLKAALPEAAIIAARSCAVSSRAAASRRISPTARRRRVTSWSARTASAPRCASNILPDVAPLYAGYTAWRGLVTEAAFPPRCTRLFEDFSFCLPDNEQMLGYPVAGPDNDLRPGHRRYNFVWYRPASEARELPRLLTDDTGRTHALSIPPPLIAREVIAEMREAARRCSRRSSTRWSRCARSRSCSRSTISKCRAWRSAASRSSAMRRSWRVRMSVRVSQRRRRMR